ncbi:hypothetical protein cypCar_00035983 [Cyprinus carpio]|nr:hypothetical protein cypCar_00035983 [Cyprinus carpio]
MAVSLLDVLSCPVCTELFRDPVLLSCSHSFCRQCIKDHWTLSSSRRCYICRLASPQEPVSNLALRNACVSYLREQNMRTEEDGGLKCHIHGEKIELFCEIDEKAICSTCMDYEHRRHQTQPLKQALRQRKEKLKATLRSAENTLLSLQNGTSRDSKISSYIQSQTQMTERTIRMEFEKLHQFLRKEEESRIVALNEEEKQKKGHIERRIQGEILSLSDRVREAEQQIEDNAITFLQNYDSILNSTYPYCIIHILTRILSARSKTVCLPITNATWLITHQVL